MCRQKSPASIRSSARRLASRSATTADAVGSPSDEPPSTSSWGRYGTDAGNGRAGRVGVDIGGGAIVDIAGRAAPPSARCLGWAGEGAALPRARLLRAEKNLGVPTRNPRQPLFGLRQLPPVQKLSGPNRIGKWLQSPPGSR